MEGDKYHRYIGMRLLGGSKTQQSNLLFLFSQTRKDRVAGNAGLTAVFGRKRLFTLLYGAGMWTVVFWDPGELCSPKELYRGRLNILAAQ
ncbi:MAG: hypothetical protein NZM25_05870 [Leptospiraceae bacterium]|nr:hypothetical protein [Leptospiraceae bacterium]MDW8306698.1 hypothetical protein [Leptospiraceae bacterium]